MKRRNYKYGLLLVFLLSFSSFFAQDKSELQAKRNSLNKQISYTKKLIAEAKNTQRSTSRELALLDRQISYREKLIRNYRQEINGIQKDIDNKELEIEKLKATIEALKQEYAKMLYQSYKNRDAHNQLMYIFASDNFYQAYRRLKVMQHYADVRKRHAEQIIKSQEDLEAVIAQLRNMQEDKIGLIDNKSNEQSKLARDKGKREKSLDSLKQKEEELRKQQKQQEEERKRLNRAIQKIIEEELRAEKERNNGRFELTPEGKIVNENFEKNKGHLHWPVVRGVITAKFGKHAHPTIAGIYTESNGIDISTEKGAKVISVFEGTVSKIFSVPGAGMNVIIQHGAYRTVYAYLKDVKVKVGDQVSARETIGTVLDNRGENVTHFEIWRMNAKSSSAVDPQVWITR